MDIITRCRSFMTTQVSITDFEADTPPGLITLVLASFVAPATQLPPSGVPASLYQHEQR